MVLDVDDGVDEGGQARGDGGGASQVGAGAADGGVGAAAGEQQDAATATAPKGRLM
ncbi:hypothetical protein ACFQ51_50195 [Streptomyces kaempferi]